MLIMVFSLTLLLPMFVSAIYSDGELDTFFKAQLILLFTGFALWLPTVKASSDLSTNDGFLVTALFWTVLGSLGSVPLITSHTLEIGIVDAIFESISGLTTTGATVITGLDDLPPSLLFYRQFLQWLGGIGIVVICLLYTSDAADD